MLKSLSILIALLLIPATVACSSASAAPSPQPTLDDIEARFDSTCTSLTDATFNPGISQSEAEARTIDFFMESWEIPKGRGTEETIKSGSTTAIYSGAKGGWGEWDVFDRQVWVVVLYDLPISVYGGAGMREVGAPTVERPTPVRERFPVHYNVVVDANTGEILSSELTGSGSPSSAWDEIDFSQAGIDQ